LAQVAFRTSTELEQGQAVKHSIAIIPGDGIGQEIMPEALKVLAWAEKTHGIQLDLHHDARGLETPT
jgi:isocitrate/isopropylmalate dehydrogenase